MIDLVIMIKEEGDGIELFVLYVIVFLGVLFGFGCFCSVWKCFYYYSICKG